MTPGPSTIPASQLALPRTLTIPLFKVEAPAEGNEGGTGELAIAPYNAVPVGYQWQINTIYLPLAFYCLVKTKESHIPTVNAAVTFVLRRSSEAVWITTLNVALRDVVEVAGEQSCQGTVLLGESLQNPIIVNPANNLALEGQCRITATCENEICAVKKMIMANQKVGNEKLFPNTTGVMNYGLFS